MIFFLVWLTLIFSKSIHLVACTIRVNGMLLYVYASNILINTSICEHIVLHSVNMIGLVYCYHMFCYVWLVLYTLYALYEYVELLCPSALHCFDQNTSSNKQNTQETNKQTKTPNSDEGKPILTHGFRVLVSHCPIPWLFAHGVGTLRKNPAEESWSGCGCQEANTGWEKWVQGRWMFPCLTPVAHLLQQFSHMPKATNQSIHSN